MKQEQLPLLQAETSWFHIFKAMIMNKEVAKLGPYATTVYLVIKGFTNWKTGKSFPDLKTIVEYSGISQAQVMKCLKTLEDSGYLTKIKVGRSNMYTLREKVAIFDTKDEDKRPVAEATWDYLPSVITQACAELKNFIVSGDTDKLQVVHIENFILNIQQNYDHATGKINNNASASDLIMNLEDNHPLKRAYLASQKASKHIDDKS